MRSGHRSSHVSRVVLTALLVLGLSASVAAAAWPSGVMHHAVVVSRIAGPSRYANSVSAARAAHPGWTGVDHVIVASGTDAGIVDALAASPLCWAYDAPMFLVGSTGLPTEVAQALAEIRSVNPTVTVTVVDNTTVVPPSVLSRIKTSVGASATVEQPWPTASRYSLSRAVAARVRAEAAATSRTVPSVVFIVNGQSAAGMLEGAPAAALAARTGIPVIVTRTNDVVASTAAAVAESKAAERVVVGSATAVSSAVASKLHANARWTGTLTDNSVAIANRAVSRGWTRRSAVVFYRTLPDALAGAQIAGAGKGVSLYIAPPRLAKPTATVLSKITTTPARRVPVRRHLRSCLPDPARDSRRTRPAHDRRAPQVGGGEGQGHRDSRLQHDQGDPLRQRCLEGVEGSHAVRGLRLQLGLRALRSQHVEGRRVESQRTHDVLGSEASRAPEVPVSRHASSWTSPSSGSTGSRTTS